MVGGGSPIDLLDPLIAGASARVRRAGRSHTGGQPAGAGGNPGAARRSTDPGRGEGLRGSPEVSPQVTGTADTVWDVFQVKKKAHFAHTLVEKRHTFGTFDGG